MTSFEALREALVERAKEWDAPNLPLSYLGTELGGEAGEALNEIKKLERERFGMKGSRTTRKKLAQELADTVICADRVAMYENINLGAEVAEVFNAKSEELNLKTRIEPTSDDEIERAKALLKASGYHVYPKERVVDVRVGHKIPLDELTGFTLGEELLIKHHKQTMAVEIGRYLYDDNDIVWQQRRDSDMGLCIQGTVRLVKPKPENET